MIGSPTSKKGIFLKIPKILTHINGAATLLMTLVLMTVGTLIIIFAGNYATLQTRSTANINRSHQAFQAAQAGLEFGINYLRANSSTILASPVSGYIPAYSDSNTANVTLANNSRYTISYSNPVAYNYTLIQISSTGLSDDGSASRTVSQLVAFGSMLLNSPTVPLIAKGNVSLSGNSEIINTYNNNTVRTGGTVSMSGSSSTVISSGTGSTAGNIQSDIQQNQNSLSTMSDADFFASYFGVSESSLKSSVANYYSNSSNTNYQGALDGKTGTSIWIDQTSGTAAFNGNMTVGSAANPVLLIVNGDVRFSGNVTIYGYVYILGDSTTDLLGNVTIVGGMSTTDNLSATGSIQVSYSPTVLGNLQNNGSMRYYAKVPGSWKDF